MLTSAAMDAVTPGLAKEMIVVGINLDPIKYRPKWMIKAIIEQAQTNLIGGLLYMTPIINGGAAATVRP